MQKKMFWLLLMAISVLLDVTMSLLWATILTLPAVVLCWWIVYRSGWIDG